MEVSYDAVYPRVGGETEQSLDARTPRQGLSPRGRGNPVLVHPDRQTVRSIPAWAGKPSSSSAHGRARRVYPRVGGETSARPRAPATIFGLSPRGRGNHRDHAVPLEHSRSIPAWAGKPAVLVNTQHVLGVYPRVGGETPE